MGKKKAPAAPDPYATANAQAQVNADAARTQARINRVNSSSPFGSVTYNEGDNDRWTETVTLSPQQQRLYEQGVRLDTETGQLALDMLPQAREALLQPMALDDADARDRATAGIMSRLEPQFERDRGNLESRLISQGFTPGSEAYNRAADEMARARTDARMQAISAGLNESRAAAGFANSVRGQRISELGALFGIGPGMQGPQGAQAAPVGVNAPDLQGQINANYQTRTGQVASQNAGTAQAAGAAVSAVTAAAVIA